MKIGTEEAKKIKNIIEKRIKDGKVAISKSTKENLTIICNPLNKASNFYLTIINWRKMYWTYNEKLKSIRIQINGDLKIKDLKSLDIKWALDLQKELKEKIYSESEKNKENVIIEKKNNDIVRNIKKELELEEKYKIGILKQIETRDDEISELKRKIQIKENYIEIIINKVSELEKKIILLKKEIRTITNIKNQISDYKLEKDHKNIEEKSNEKIKYKVKKENFNFIASKELKIIITHRIRSGKLKFESRIPKSNSSIIYNPHIEEGNKFHLTIYINGKNWEKLHWTYKDKHFQFDDNLVKKIGIKVDSRWASQIQDDWKKSINEFNEFIEERIIN